MEYKDDDLTSNKYQQVQAKMMGYMKTKEASAGHLQNVQTGRNQAVEPPNVLEDQYRNSKKC